MQPGGYDPGRTLADGTVAPNLRQRDEAELGIAAGDELRQRLGFSGIGWGLDIRNDAWSTARDVLGPAEAAQLTTRGRTLSVAEYRALLASDRVVVPSA